MQKTKSLIVEWQNFIKNGLPLNGKKSSITIGIFDGVHKGHQALIQRVVSQSGFVPAVITFKENHKTDECAALQTFEEKKTALENLGIKILLVIEFTESFRRMSGLEFLEILFKRCNIGYFAAGADFRCGCQGDTDAAAIKKFFESRGITAEIVPQVMYKKQPISSSRIRTALAKGDVELAQFMLKKPY